MRENRRKFGNSGLDEKQLEKIVERKYKHLRADLDPLDRMRFNELSSNCKKLLFKHRSRCLRKYDPDLFKSM